MEWISFSLDQEKRNGFENELMPTLCKRYGSLLDMANQTWNAYFERTGVDSYRCVFCSDSVILIKFVKEYAGNYLPHYTTPDVKRMEHYGNPHILNL